MNAGERSYHHGDLRRTLVEEGLKLAREGGVGALGLREITRAVGVTANAAYRHFGDHHDLVVAIAFEAQQLLARRIVAAMETIPVKASDQDRALQPLRGFCHAYLDFALCDPGWFELACYSQHSPADTVSVLSEEPPIPPPYILLVNSLDELVTTGMLSAQNRRDAEWVCWSALQGFAGLTISGPLQRNERARLDDLGSRVVEACLAGLGLGGSG